MRPRAFVALAAITASLMLSACAGDPAPTESASPTQAVENPKSSDEVISLDGSGVSGLGNDVISDQKNYVHVTWPVLDGVDALTDALEENAQATVDDYLREYQADAGASAVSRPSLSGTWSFAGYSPKMVGVIVRSYLFAGANGAEQWSTTWLDVESGEVLENLDLIDDDKHESLADEVRAQAKADLPVSIMPEQLDAALAEEPEVVAFTEEGELAVGFSAYTVAAGSAGLVTFTLPLDTTEGLLSEAGQSARKAALEPEDPDTQEEPTAEPPNESEVPPEAAGVDCAVEKCIALTYDDGPGPETLQVASAFSERGQRATFFVLGSQVQSWPDEVAAVLGQGHEIGLHTWNHPSLIQLGESEIREQLQDTADAVQAAGGGDVQVFRPPYGATDDIVRGVAAELGLSEVLWSVDTLDWQDRDTAVVIDRVLSEAEPGTIVLMHDIHPTTVAAAPAIVDALVEQGYHLVTVSELLGGVEPGESYSTGQTGA